MDITCHNFKESLSVIQDALNEASFIAIDAEFTGLNNGKILHAFDTPEERYSKLREGALDFLLIQFGLCTFKSVENKRYQHKAFNFFVFPKPYRRNYPDARFMCQSSCLDFLLTQGFDFNKLFRDGISYLSPVDEQKLKEQLEQKHYQQDHAPSVRLDSPMADEVAVRSPVPIPEQHKSFVENTCKLIETFMSSEDEILELEPCNSFLRKLIFQTAKQRFPSGLYMESKSTPKKDFYIAVTKASSDKLKEMETAKKNSEVEELDDAIGFTKIINMISRADFDDFKAVTKCVFKRLIDTKLMANTIPFKEKINRTMLSDLLKILQKEPFSIPDVEVAPGFKSYSTVSEQLHVAGYDAYITGLCFIGMAQYLESFKKPKEKSESLKLSLLKPFMNKLYLMKVQDIPYLNLAGEDFKPDRDHVFHVKFPKEWKTSDLMQLFEPFGHVFVSWVDETSAFVALTRKNQAALVMRTLTQSDIYHVQAYKQYAMKNKKPNPYAAMLQDGGKHGVKRNLPESDVNTKRRRRNSNDDEVVSRPTIDPIPEEEEPEEDESSDVASSCDSNSNGNTIIHEDGKGMKNHADDDDDDANDSEDSSDEPKSDNEKTPKKSKHGEKLFDESNEWT